MKRLIIALSTLIVLVVAVAGSATVLAHSNTHHTSLIPAAICAETQTGPAKQESLLFCQSTIEPDGGIVYDAAINAANSHIIVGSPTFAAQSVDWGGNAITYVEFSSGFHLEYHSDNFMRFYNSQNRQVFP